MSAELSPYLNFRGQARDALAFYEGVFGGQATASSFKDLGMPVDPAEEDQVMHGQLRLPTGQLLMASDVPSHMEYVVGRSTFSVALSGDDLQVLTGWWEGLSDGATILEPLSQAPWGDHFGMLTDRFGVPWLVNIAGSAA